MELYVKIIMYVLLFVLCEFVYAQPIITYHADHSIGTTADLYLLGGDVTAFEQTGSGLTWNITSNTTIAKAGTYESVTPQSTPYGSNFPTANLAYKRSVTGMGTTYTYLLDSPTDLSSLGDEIGGTKPTLWTQKDKVLQYPFAYSESFNATRQSSTGQPESYIRTYDAYGTLTINNKSYSNVVRINKSNGNSIWFLTTPVLFPLLIQVGSNNTILYLEPNNLTSVETVTTSPFISFAPNPATEYMTITLSDEHRDKGTELLLLNNVGQCVLQTTIETNSAKVAVHGLASGMYLGIIRSNNSVVYQQTLIIR